MAVLLLAAPAASQPRADSAPARVGLLTVDPAAPSSIRAADELRAMGFEVSGPLEPDIDALVTIGWDSIDVQARVGDPPIERRASFPLGASENERATALLRALEFVRACLLPVPAATASAPPAAPPPPQPPEPSRSSPSPPTPEPRAASESPAPAVDVGAGPALLYGTGASGLSALLQGSLNLRVAAGAVAGASAWIPWHAQTIDKAEGSAKLSPGVLSLDATVSPWNSPWADLAVGGGVAAVMLSISAEANPGFVGRSERKWTAVPHAQLSVAFVVARPLRVGLSILAGTSLYRPRIAFDGREMGEWGALIVGGCASLRMGFD